MDWQLMLSNAYVVWFSQQPFSKGKICNTIARLREKPLTLSYTNSNGPLHTESIVLPNRKNTIGTTVL